MCRLFGAVSSEVSSFAFSLQEAPRSLAALSPDHPHGWGLAVHDDARGWDVQRHPACARDDAGFRGAAAKARGRVVIAHVRKRTVGPTSIVNTHPFRSGRWVFAHNGTIDDLAYLEQRTSSERRRAVEGQTDSERLFAFLLTAVDDAGGAGAAIDGALASALTAATKHPRIGAANFLLSDGQVLYAFRFGRALHALSRTASRAGDEARRKPAVLIASECPTDEPWREVAEGTLLRVDGGAEPAYRAILGHA